MRRRQLGSLLAVALGVSGLTTALVSAPATALAAGSGSGGDRGCVLQNGVKHVIYLQFDNTHYSRDAANVPSDLEQLPNLLDFLTGQGTLVTHEHTPLIAHTANDITTSETGVYGDRTGLAVSNTYQYYTSSGVAATTDTAGSFAYWNDPIVDYSTATGAPAGDSSPTLVDQNGTNAPAPWVSYTRAGCDFGTVASADTELENTVPDVADVFGADSPAAKEAADPNQQNKAAADFEGLAVHCARTSAICSTANGGVADRLPDEPGGYHGYNALYGSRFVAPAISPSGPVRDLDGAVIKDSDGDVGFPGYNGMIGKNALAYTLDMQASGVPVTYTYLTDMHESWTTGDALGPGDPTYERQLRDENAAFGTFFAGLAAHGITRQNTLFVVTADEGDHFVGGAGTPAGCDGVTVTCSYSKIGEVDGDLTGLLAGAGVTTPFDVSADSAPEIYVKGQPARTSAAARTMERATAGLTADDLATGRTVRLTNYLADPVEMKLLHMVTGDPRRTPTYALFANSDFWLSSGNAPCGGSCVSLDSSEAWNHGDVAPEINTTWLGIAGPGVRHLGVDNALWSDHTDINPTMLALLGLHSDYVPDGRVLTEVLDRQADPAITHLGEVYSQLEAAVGAFGLDTLAASTRALASDSPGDATYTRVENQLIRLGQERDALVAAIRPVLDGDGHGGRGDARAAGSLIGQGESLLRAAGRLAE